jgi:hypothetical protein
MVGRVDQDFELRSHEAMNGLQRFPCLRAFQIQMPPLCGFPLLREKPASFRFKGGG